MVISLPFTLLADSRFLQKIMWNEPTNNCDLLITKKETAAFWSNKMDVIIKLLVADFKPNSQVIMLKSKE